MRDSFSLSNATRHWLKNERDYSRLFVVDYLANHMEVHMFDFIHTEKMKDFRHNSFRIRIRLLNGWKQMLSAVGFKKSEYFGDWGFTPYDKNKSKRLIVVAHK